MQISLQANNAALTVLRSAFEQIVHTQTPKSDNNLIATMNNIGGSSLAKAGLTEDLFSVHHMDVAQMKVQIFERLGEKFSLKQDDFETFTDYARAIRRDVDGLKDKAGGLLALATIEKELGLDKLGISIDTVINAMLDPTSDAAKQLNEALENKLGENGKKMASDDADLRLNSITMDKDGFYKR